MKKKFISKLLILASGLISIPAIATACSTNDDNHYVFALSTTANQGDFNQFANDVEQTFNKLKKQESYSQYSDLADITISVNNIDDNDAKRDLVENGSASFAFLTAKTLTKNNFYQQVNAKVQTLTTAFTFDTDMSKSYVNGLDPNDEQGSKDGSIDPLREIANNMQKASFGENYQYPFNTWKDTEGTAPNYNWNGIRYTAFYSEDKLISGYRGMIFLTGTDAKINEAIKAWDDKNWENFRNLGIMVGKDSSSGNYLLQEQLIKNHFNNLRKNWTIAEDRKSHQDKYDTDSYGTSKTNNENFTIHFSDEASFAWTHYDGTTTDYSTISNGKIKILTVTNYALYDIGVFSKNVDARVADLLSESMIYLYNNKNNLYGEGLGYNGYQKIKNIEAEIINPMKLAIGM
ncbi:MAG: hypothetical protein K2I67_02220 [Malacoplasma sp.]|nr:hypothetical protein [Malacoplasma sp.]